MSSGIGATGGTLEIWVWSCNATTHTFVWNLRPRRPGKATVGPVTPPGPEEECEDPGGACAAGPRGNVPAVPSSQITESPEWTSGLSRPGRLVPEGTSRPRAPRVAPLSRCNVLAPCRQPRNGEIFPPVPAAALSSAAKTLRESAARRDQQQRRGARVLGWLRGRGARRAGFEKLSGCVCVEMVRGGTPRGVMWRPAWGSATSR